MKEKTKTINIEAENQEKEGEIEGK